jgi:hypothetical protein
MFISVWDSIYTALLDNGIDVYPPATKEGECTSQYVVVKSDGATQKGSLSTSVCYTILCYVPQLEYYSLEPLVERVKSIMRSIEPMVKPTGLETPSFYDDTYKAHMISIQYKNNKQNSSL